jgi:hypothetical protein
MLPCPAGDGNHLIVVGPTGARSTTARPGEFPRGKPCRLG